MTWILHRLRVAKCVVMELEQTSQKVYAVLLWLRRSNALSENVAGSPFRDGKRNFEFTMVMYHLDNSQRSYKSQTKYAERMILPSSSQKYSRKYL